MSDLTPEQEYELRDRQLRQDKELRDKERELKEQELSQRRSDSRFSRWNGPLLAATIAGSVALYGSQAVDRQAQDKQELASRELCYRLLSDALNRHRDGARDRASQEFQLIARAVSSRSTCEETLREAADALYKPDALPPSGKCEKFESIKKLGWSGGHKTNFCKSLGYDGVFNPFGDYSAGGYCFTGDAPTCRATIQAQGK